jgi:hypothetical protein
MLSVLARDSIPCSLPNSLQVYDDLAAVPSFCHQLRCCCFVGVNYRDTRSRIPKPIERSNRSQCNRHSDGKGLLFTALLPLKGLQDIVGVKRVLPRW